MRAAVGRGVRDVPIEAHVLLATTALLVVTVVAGSDRTRQIAVLLAIAAPLAAGHRVLLRWPTLVSGLLLVILLIPIKRYKLEAGLPFDLEPYRIIVAVLVALWATSLLIDERVRLRATGLEAPLALIVAATLGSELVNPGRVQALSDFALKALTFFLSFVLVFYLIVSVLRTRAALERVLKVLVACGGVIALSAVVERWTQFNVFNHLEQVFPRLVLQDTGVATRGGDVRATASSAHPIELSVVMAMLLPLAVYLATTLRRPLWWFMAGALVMGNLATGSRTGIIGVLVAGVVVLILRPRAVISFWPAALPALVIIHFAVPGALGGIKQSFFPQGGIIAEQQHVVVGNARLSNNRLADIGPALDEYAQYNPLFGQGYGTRVTGFDTLDQERGNAAILDDQWLKTLLETGLAGVAAWLWIFTRSIRRLGARARRDRESPIGSLATALAASIAAYAACMITYDAFSFTQSAFLLWVLLALSAVCLQLEPAGRALRRIGRAPRAGAPGAV